MGLLEPVHSVRRSAEAEWSRWLLRPDVDVQERVRPAPVRRDSDRRLSVVVRALEHQLDAAVWLHDR